MATQNSMDGPKPQPAPPRPFARGIWIGVVYGALYGLLMRAAVFWADRPRLAGLSHAASGASMVMSIGFIFGVPVAIGFITTSTREFGEDRSTTEWIFMPWVAVLLMMLATLALVWEGIICIAMALPVALVFSSIGGICGGLTARSRLTSRRTTACVALLPLLIAPAESRIGSTDTTRMVQNDIVIHAPAEVVWHNVERVRAIDPREIRTTWTQRIGFPKPVEATLSHEGVGGVRNASFERGLNFVETVTAWEPNRRIAFTIRADTANIPPTTLDEHVSIGGPYFDVLDGEYRLEPLANGDTLVHLTSHQRLSTHFNGYAGLWTDNIMSNLQSSILEVVQHRCEHP